jgi:hypothetical protein
VAVDTRGSTQQPAAAQIVRSIVAIAVRSKCAYARLRRRITASVSEIVRVTITHRLGKGEAVRRIKEGFAQTSGHLGPMIAIEQHTWEGDRLRFRLRALGQTAAASIEVLEDTLRIEVSLPWLLAKAANRLLAVLRKEATRLLEKK